MIRLFLSIVKPGKRTFLSAALVSLLVAAGVGRAQSEGSLADPILPPPLLPAREALPPREALPAKEAGPQSPVFDPMIQQASGSCCGRAPSNHYYGRSNIPCNGRPPCGDDCDHHTFLGRLIGGFGAELCCPDPCYEPRWIWAANAAFFQDTVRPGTLTRLRYDYGQNYNFPDTAEFFWAKINGKGPGTLPPNNMRWADFALYQEIGTLTASAFVETTYRSIEPGNSPSRAGFGDVNVGFKSVLVDSELLLVSMQFKTYIPAGIANRGLGTGHVSLEPSLLFALKLADDTYLQGQIAEWIPIAGTGGFAGSVFHYHASLNHQWCQYANYLAVISTLEMNGFSFRGQFTDETGVAVGNVGANFLSAGPGVRFVFCDRADLGVGMAFGFGNRHGPDQLYRTEFRIRY